MPGWTKFVRTDGQSPDSRSLITLRPKTLAFNSHFIRSNKLTECTRVSIFCDPERYRIGLKFHADASDQNSFALCADGGRKVGDNRACQVNALMKRHRWLKAASLSTSFVSRRYQPNWFPADGMWVISVRPSFEARSTSADAIETGLCGIYRYLAGDRVVYIGRGDIRARAKSSERDGWQYDAIEYSVIEDSSDQEKWESLWLDDHRNEFGVLPVYNRIAGKKALAANEPI